MNEIERCGSEVHAFLWWLHHHGDPRHDQVLIQEITTMLSSINQVTISSLAQNPQLKKEVAQAAAKTLVAAAGRFANTATSIGAAA